MENQNRAILALGSNEGDRLKTIKQCIDLLHHNVGTVIKVSPVYETPALGFAGDPFFNCALLLHTDYDASDLLQKILTVEKDLGRIRTSCIEYQSRPIDIDIISFNDSVLSFDNLVIPHPKMQERLFVLLPMRDLETDWHHPVLLKSLPELILSTGDKSQCRMVQKIVAPLDDLLHENFNYIAIEGNIGAGKTTLTTRIATDLNAKTVLERFADNPFLPKFYEDQTRFAFPLEMSFLADRYQQIADDLAQFDLFHDFIIADYHIFKSLIFAKITLTEDEYRLYRKLFEIIYREMPKPDLYVYLYQSTERLLQNIKIRGRSYEQEIPADYLEKINSGYLEYINSQTNLNVLIIDVSDRDFVKNQHDYVFILDQIKNKMAFKLPIATD